MSENRLYRSEELTQQEWQLVDAVKRTLQVLARVTRHKELEQVKKDIDPKEQMDKDALEALAKEHLTPDLPGLNDHEETIAIGRLASAIFVKLRTADDNTVAPP